MQVDDDDFFYCCCGPVVDMGVNLWMVTFSVNIIQVQFKS